jgi:N-methylhydantoinase A
VLGRLNERGREKMKQDAVAPDKVEVLEYADMRYVGQSYELTVELSKANRVEKAVAAFHDLHRALYGHCDPARVVEFVNLRTVHVHRLPSPSLAASPASGRTAASASRKAYFASLGDYVDTPVHLREQLAPGVDVRGPCIVEQPDTTLVVYPGQSVQVLADGSLLVEVKRGT